VFILNGNFLDAFPADEELVPHDGEPHPEHPPMVFGPNPQAPNWQFELNGAATNLGSFGANQAQGHHIHHQAAKEVEEEDEDVAEMVMEEAGNIDHNKNEIQIENDANAGSADVQHDPLHQEMDLNLSGSSMRFLRANGPDLNLDEVFQGIFSNEDSSSSSDATSPLNEDMLRFIVAQNQCATITIFHRRGLPNGPAPGASNLKSRFAFRPILIDNPAP
jgi:hypothetical protein